MKGTRKVESGAAKQEAKKDKAGSKHTVVLEKNKGDNEEVSKSEQNSKIDTESREISSTEGNEKVDDKKNEDMGKSVKESMSVSEWICGDLVWAQISGHPFWPGIVTVDPALGLFEKSKKGRGESVLRDYHIQFFGDKGSHCWVSAGRIFKFEGESNMRDLVLTKKKDKRFSSAIPDGKGSILLKWKCAVKEADDAVLQSRKERVEYFEEYYPLKLSVKQRNELKKQQEEPSSSSDQQGKEETKVQSRKRGRTAPIQKDQDSESDPDGSSNKKQKVSVNSEGSKLRSRKAKKENEESDSKADEEEDKLKKNNESNSDDDFANEEGKRKRKKAGVKPPQKTKYKRKEKLYPGDFEVFFEKSAPHCLEINSKFENDEEGLRRYLKKMWETMNDEEKSKFGEYPVTSS